MSQAVPRNNETYVALALRGEEASHWSAVNHAPGVSHDMIPAVTAAMKHFIKSEDYPEYCQKHLQRASTYQTAYRNNHPPQDNEHHGTTLKKSLVETQQRSFDRVQTSTQSNCREEEDRPAE